MTGEAFLKQLEKAGLTARKALHDALDAAGKAPVVEAMRYATDGGKGLRAFLVMEGAAIHGVTADIAAPCAAAIEALHAYSLIHDDLPAMDDDDLRRGRPTVHVQWDEATAILAGDALQSLAFELVAGIRVSAEIRIALTRGLAQASGVSGMVGGQAMDIAAESASGPLNIDEIKTLQAGKTGALFEWSAMAGPMLAAADPKPLQDFAKSFGLAFQISDDILDVVGNEESTGKRVNKDAKAGKATFVSLLGLDRARSEAAAMIQTAKDSISIYGEKAAPLIAAADFILTRDK